jgi:hypothetical protein
MDTPKGNGPAPVQVTIQWDNEDLAAHPVQAANAFMLQGSGHEIVLTIGFAVPPFYATPEEATKARTMLAKTIARIALTPPRMSEIITIMQQALAAIQGGRKS